MILVICIQYMVFIFRADNEGEGGILALTALLGFNKNSDIKKRGLKYIPIGLFGAALLFGDGVITPAISVLSAVEGIKYATPVFEPYILPITFLVIITLFTVQRFGTGKIGFIYGPVILLWFVSIGTLGLIQVFKNMSVLAALNPVHAVRFFLDNGSNGFLILGSVFLVITGGESLYADLGHFGKKPVRLSWFFVALPCLLLNYLGQGSLVLSNPDAIQNPFYFLSPPQLLLPLVILATSATVIASQALISGVFSLTRQAVQLGYFPRINIVHTSSREIGQIYIPLINWVLMASVLWVVFEFKTSADLVSAYGIAVSATMVITTFLTSRVAVHIWKWKPIYSLFFLLIFFTINAAFFIACSIKFFDGGWVPVLIAGGVFTLMTTWSTGRKILREHLKSRSISVEEFVKKIKETPPTTVSGTAIYMSGDPWGIPIPLLHNLKHNKVMHQKNIILTIKTGAVPLVSKSERITIEKLSTGIYRVIAKYGFMETPQISEIITECKTQGLDLGLEDTTFFLGRETILPSKKPGMSIWREIIFAVMSRNAQRPTVYYGIPVNQVIEVGIQVEI